MSPSSLHRWLLALAVSVCVFAGTAASAAAGARVSAANATVTFRKIFKSSYPEFVEIKVNQSGAGTYDIRQLNEESNPRAMQIDAPLVHRRIANLGEKTFVFDRGAESHRVTFNYTLNRDAAELLGIFEGLARQQTDLSDLDRTMRYDPLGVNDILLQIEKDLDHKLLPEPGQFLPPLDRVAADQHFIDIARDRARKLAGRIRSAP